MSDGQYTYSQVMHEMQRGPVRDGLIKLFELEFTPTREQLMGYEHVRSSGRYNCFTEMNSVIRQLHVIGAHDTLAWFERCKSHGISYFDALELAYRHHSDMTVDAATAERFDIHEAEWELMQAQEQLRMTRERIQALRSGGRKE